MIEQLGGFYPWLVGVHSVWRWAVLLAAVGAVAVGIWGLVRGISFPGPGRHASRIFVTAMDLQLLVGILLYLTSPIVRAAWADFGGAMRAQELRFFTVEHTFTMLVAIALAHIGSARARRAPTAAKGYARMVLWFGLSLVVLLIGTPWWRPLWRGLAGA